MYIMKRVAIGLVLVLAALATGPKGHVKAQTMYYMQDYFVGVLNFPRDGTHGMQQEIVGNALYYTKQFPSPTPIGWEVFYATANGDIHFWEDNSNPNSVFAHSDNLWLKYQMYEGEEITHPNNTIRFASDPRNGGDCTVYSGPTSHPYITKLDAVFNYNLGIYLGTRSVIRVKDWMSAQSVNWEYHFYAYGAGWVGWEEWDTTYSTTVPKNASYFTDQGYDSTGHGHVCLGTPPTS